MGSFWSSCLLQRVGKIDATEGEGSTLRLLNTLPEPVATPKPVLATPSAAATPAEMVSKIPQSATTSPNEVDKEVAWSGYQEGRRIGNRRFREGFPQPSGDYVDQITAAVNADRLPMWKLGFKKGYLSAWPNQGKDL